MNLLNFIKDTLNNGGASYNLLTGDYNPNFGYMVAVKGHELKLPITQFHNKSLAEYIASKCHILMTNSNCNMFLGAWVDKGFVYLDVSQLITDKIKALNIAISQNEIAIFDNENKESVYTKDYEKIDFDTITKDRINTLYLEYVNNFITVEKFAEHYQLHTWQAEKIINLGREFLNK